MWETYNIYKFVTLFRCVYFGTLLVSELVIVLYFKELLYKIQNQDMEEDKVSFLMNNKLFNAVQNNDAKIISEQLDKLPSNIASALRPNPSLIFDDTTEKIRLEGLRQDIKLVNNKLDQIIKFLGITIENKPNQDNKTFTRN